MLHYRPFRTRTRLNEPTAAKIDVISFSIRGINKFSSRNGALTKIRSALSRRLLLPPRFIPTCVARREVRDFSLLTSWFDVAATRRARITKITILHNGRNIGWYEIRAAQANARYLGASSLFAESNAQICRHSKPGRGNCRVIKARDAGVRETPGALPEAR